MTVFTVLMFWHRPVAVTRAMLWVALICTIIPWRSSAFIQIQIPIQTALDNGKDEALLEKLIVTDWLRVVPFFVQIITVFIMLTRSLNTLNTSTH